ncbi:alpha/beta fold hydrolase [Streptomyces sp. NPDC057257]|uniref:alpha/beta fold hydrolase n=1 Tax=Streptomyces sp. NPDC057257 TaxID=3346071 RepID=UPI00363CFEE7
MTGAPHLGPHRAVTSRRGCLWIPGDVVGLAGGMFLRGPMFAEWEAPEPLGGLPPVVLVHGGGGQGTDWLTTPDGRDGWARELVAAGFPVYVVDRPGHGRSPRYGEVGAAPPVEVIARVFAPKEREGTHTQWPWRRDPEGAELTQLASSAGPMATDLAAAQDIEARRLTSLLERTGPAIVITHSAGAPAGWLTAARGPGNVLAVVAVEPMGPPFSDIPHVGHLAGGLTCAELPDAALRDLPVAVVTGSASPFPGSGATAEFLRGLGARVTPMPLRDLGLTGNGHAPMIEANSSDVLVPIVDWIRSVLPAH